MIGNSTAECVWVVMWAGILHSISPICIAYTLLSLFVLEHLPFPRIVGYWAAIETIFYSLTYIYRQYHLQRPAQHPRLPSKEERLKLFALCEESTLDYTGFLSKWFLNVPVAAVKRDNVKDFLRWAFFNTATGDPIHDGEVEEYTQKYEKKLGVDFEPGRGDVRCIRLTIDKVDTLHRSLIWYMCIFVVDVLTHGFMRLNSYQFYRASAVQSMAVVPPRPHAFVASKRSPTKDISYWHYPHTSKTELPIVFLHGIGVGLYPYMPFLKEMNQGRSSEEGTIGIIAIEILAISSRITTPVLGKEEMSRQIRTILDHHGFDRFVLASHSYGSVISTYLLKTPDIAERIASMVLVDPISILLHQPDVAYNFIARKPRFANEWLVWFFGSKDMGVAHTLSRTFFWSENILWKEDLLGHRAVVLLCEKDSILNAPHVREYLERVKMDKPAQDEKSEAPDGMLAGRKHGCLDIVWCPNLDHGQIFDKALWRNLLKTKLLREARQAN